MFSLSSETLEHARKSRGLTIQALAEMTGVNSRTIQYLAAGREGSSITVARIRAFLAEERDLSCDEVRWDGFHLLDLCIEKHFTCREVAGIIGVSVSAMHSWCYNLKVPSPQYVDSLADFFRVEPMDFFVIDRFVA